MGFVEVYAGFACVVVICVAALLILREYRGDVDLLDTIIYVKNKTLRLIRGPGEYGLHPVCY